jgi:hypothetical protein
VTLRQFFRALAHMAFIALGALFVIALVLGGLVFVETVVATQSLTMAASLGGAFALAFTLAILPFVLIGIALVAGITGPFVIRRSGAGQQN